MWENNWNTSVARELYPPSTTDYGVSTRVEAKQESKKLPAGEKLLYLGSIVCCVTLALIVISLHARVTELNLGIQKMEREISAINKKKQELLVVQEHQSSVESIRNFAEDKGLELSLPKMLP